MTKQLLRLSVACSLGVTAAGLFVQPVFAQFATPGLTGTDLRPKSMGNAFIAVSNDPNALFYNPAGLSDVEKWEVHLLGASLQVSSQMLETGVDIAKSAGDFSKKPQSEQTSKIIKDWVDPMIGSYHPFNVGVTGPGFTVRRFSIRSIGDLGAAFDIQNKVLPRFNAEGAATAGMMGGFSWDWMDKGIEAGFAVKTLFRAFAPVEAGFSDLMGKDPVTGKDKTEQFTDDITDFSSRQGYAVGGDIGLKTHLEAFTEMIDIPAVSDLFELLHPTAGIVWQDVLDTRFQMEVNEDEASNPDLIRKYKIIPQSMGFGTAISPTFGPLRVSYALDFRDLNRDTAFNRKIFTGLELMIWNRIGFRMGLAGMSPGEIAGYTLPVNSLGFDLDLWLIKFGAYYFEEFVGSRSNERRSRKMATSLQLKF